MLSKLFKHVRGFFFLSVSDCDKTELETEINKANMAKVKAIAITFIVLEVIRIVTLIIINKEGFLKRPDLYYFAMYVLLILAMSTFLVIFSKIGKDIPKHQISISVVGISFTVFLLFWCAGISLLDQISYGQIIIYLTAMLSIAVVPLFQPIVFFLIYMAAQVFFVCLMPHVQKSCEILLGNYINSTLFIILSLVIARIRYKTWIEDYKNKKIIQEKGNEIKKVNRELRRQTEN
jgi:hypothetical protein